MPERPQALLQLRIERRRLRRRHQSRLERESNAFGGLPLTERVKEKLYGVWVVDVRTGGNAAEPDSDLIAGAFALPAEALKEVAGV